MKGLLPGEEIPCALRFCQHGLFIRQYAVFVFQTTLAGVLHISSPPPAQDVPDSAREHLHTGLGHRPKSKIFGKASQQNSGCLPIQLVGLGKA